MEGNDKSQRINGTTTSALLITFTTSPLHQRTMTLQYPEVLIASIKLIFIYKTALARVKVYKI